MFLKNKLKYVTFFIFVLLLTVGCGSASVYKQVDFAKYFNDRSLFIGETLTITIPINSPITHVGGMFNRPNIETLAQRYMRANPGVYIVVRGLEATDITTIAEAQRLELMAGRADTLIEFPWLDWRNPATSRLLADWYPIMRADPRFNESDWFMNVFDAISKNGKILALPMEFSYEIISANTTIPALYALFSDFNAISYGDMIYLFNLFSFDNPQFVFNGFDVLMTLFSSIDSFFCLEQQYINFYNQYFIDFIYQSRNMTRPERPLGFPSHQIPIIGTNTELNYSQRYYFISSNPRNASPFTNALNSTYFSGFIPLVCDDGKLIIALSSGFALNATATPVQKALAWDFVSFALNPENRQGLPEMIPAIYIPLFRHDVTRHISHFHYRARREGRWLYGDTENQIIHAINHFYDIARLPMRIVTPANFAISSIIYETLDQFNDGLISGRQAAEYLQNRITIVLMEMD